MHGGLGLIWTNRWTRSYRNSNGFRTKFCSSVLTLSWGHRTWQVGMQRIVNFSSLLRFPSLKVLKSCSFLLLVFQFGSSLKDVDSKKTHEKSTFWNSWFKNASRSSIWWQKQLQRSIFKLVLWPVQVMWAQNTRSLSQVPWRRNKMLKIQFKPL